VTEVGYAGAFLGGLLALLSPCGALLLPAFFAYAFPSHARLAGRTLVLYLGLATVLVPLGIGSAAASRLVYGHQAALATLAGVLLVGFGALELFGGSFQIGPLARLLARVRGDSVPAVFALGAVSGLAGFCSGPILGAVLTVAAASGQTVYGAALLAVYAAGMAAPLFVLAALWDRFDLAHLRWLRGYGVRIGPWRVHTTALLSGLIFVTLGVLFLSYRGTGGLTGLFEPPAVVGWQNRAQQVISELPARVPDLALLAVVAAVAVIVTAVLLRRNARRVSAGQPTADAAEEPLDGPGGRLHG
jgi:cytochrome c biogenesis protein CcdA